MPSKTHQLTLLLLQVDTSHHDDTHHPCISAIKLSRYKISHCHGTTQSQINLRFPDLTNNSSSHIIICLALPAYGYMHQKQRNQLQTDSRPQCINYQQQVLPHRESHPIQQPSPATCFFCLTCLQVSPSVSKCLFPPIIL